MSEGEMDEEKFKAIATEEKDGEAKKDFDCDQCGKTYGTWASLTTHIYNHSKDRDATAVVKAEDGVVDQASTTFTLHSTTEPCMSPLIGERRNTDGVSWTFRS